MVEGNFRELREIVFIIKAFCEDEEFAKLVYYKDLDDPLHTDLPENFDGYEELSFKQVLPYLKIIDVDEEANVYVNVFFGKSVNATESSEFKQNHLYVDIYAHQNLWKIDGGIRVYELLIRIDTLLNVKKLQNVQEEFNFVDMRALPTPNTKYAGFGLVYQRTNNGLRPEYE